MKNNYYLYIFILLMVSCGSPVPRKPVLRKTSSYLKESVMFNKTMNENEEKAFAAFMTKDSLTQYIASPNGFWYTFNQKKSNSYLPQIGDQVFYTFAVYDIDNKEIYSEKEIGEQTYIVDKQEIIEGLRNALKIMSEGEVATFLFPSHKVYGYLGDEKKIEVNQPLIYKVQLIKINRKK